MRLGMPESACRQIENSSGSNFFKQEIRTFSIKLKYNSNAVYYIPGSGFGEHSTLNYRSNGTMAAAQIATNMNSQLHDNKSMTKADGLLEHGVKMKL